MNKIFKVIWNETKHNYCVVSEIAHMYTHSSTNRSKVMSCLVAFLLSFTGSAYAALTPDQQAVYDAVMQQLAQTSGNAALGKVKVDNDKETLSLGYVQLDGKNGNLYLGTKAAGNEVGISQTQYTHGISGSNIAWGSGNVAGLALEAETKEAIIDGTKTNIITGYKRTRQADGFMIPLWNINSSGAARSYSTAIGFLNAAYGVGAFSVGQYSVAGADSAFAGGHDAIASAKQAFAFGKKVKAMGENSVAMGEESEAWAANSFALGNTAKALDVGAIAMGNNAVASGKSSFAAGVKSKAMAYSTVALGDNAAAVGNYSVALGHGSQATVEDAVATGAYAEAHGQYSSALGTSSEALGFFSTAVGGGSVKENGDRGLSMGYGAQTTVADGVSVGSNSVAGRSENVYGYNVLGGNAYDTESIGAVYGQGKKEEIEGYNKSLAEKQPQLQAAEEAYNKAQQDLDDMRHGRPGALEFTWANQEKLETEIERTKQVYENLQKEFDEIKVKRNKLTGAYLSSSAAVSVGDEETGMTRQITGVAAGSEDTDAVNVAQLKALNTKVDNNRKAMEKSVQNGSVKYFSVNPDNNKRTKPAKGSDNSKNDGAYGENSVAIGAFAEAADANALALGWSVKALGQDSLALGTMVYSYGRNSNAVGNQAAALGKESSAFGNQAKAMDMGTTALGNNAMAMQNGSTAVGYQSLSSIASTAMGTNSFALGQASLALGQRSYIGDTTFRDTYTKYNEEKGNDNNIPGFYISDLIKKNDPKIAKYKEQFKDQLQGLDGHNQEAVLRYLIIADLNKSVQFATAVGNHSTVGASQGTALGFFSTVTGAYGTALGYNSVSTAYGAMAAGAYAKANTVGSVAIGFKSKVDNYGGVAIGSEATVGKNGGVALGNKSTADRGSGVVGYVFGADNSTLTKALEAPGNKARFDELKMKIKDEDVSAYNALVTTFKNAAKDSPEKEKAKQEIETWKAAHPDFFKNVKARKNFENAWQSTYEAVSVGDVEKGITRQITGVAAGSEDTDAVNVAQLKALNTKVDKNVTDITNLKGGFTIKDTATGTVNVTLGETTKSAITFKAETQDTDGATSVLTAKVDDQKNVTYTLNTKKLKEEMGLNNLGTGTMSSWKLKVGTESTDISNGDEVIFAASTDEATKGLSVKKKGNVITYGINKSEFVGNIAGDIITEINKTTNTTKITNVDWSKFPGMNFYTQGSVNSGIYTPDANADNKWNSSHIVFGEGIKVEKFKDKDNNQVTRISLKSTGGTVTNGKSAYEIWEAYKDKDGTQPNKGKDEQAFLESLKGKDGKDGEKGKDGLNGKDGKDGTIADIKGDDKSGVSVTSNTEASKKTYTIGLGTKIKAGEVTIDGTKDKENAVVGDVKINGEKGNGMITGLSNKIWDVNKIVSGRAATEDQLQQATQNMQNHIYEIGKHMNGIAASNAALAGLHPLEYDEDDKWNLSAAIGNYKGANAFALGAFYRPNERTLLSVGGTFAGEEHLLNVGLSLKTGPGTAGKVYVSRAAMAREIQALKLQNKQREAESQKLLQDNRAIREENKEMKKELEWLKAQVAQLMAK